jgi:hypothetical protein
VFVRPEGFRLKEQAVEAEREGFVSGPAVFIL